MKNRICDMLLAYTRLHLMMHAANVRLACSQSGMCATHQFSVYAVYQLMLNAMQSSGVRVVHREPSGTRAKTQKLQPMPSSVPKAIFLFHSAVLAPPPLPFLSVKYIVGLR